MSTDIERRVGNLLNNSQSTSQSTATAAASLPSASTDTGHKKTMTTINSASSQQTDTSKEKLSVALKERQELEQVSKQLVGILTFNLVSLVCIYCAVYLTALCCILNICGIENLQASGSLKEMKSFREKLPAFKMKSEFLKAVQGNQVWRAIYICKKKYDLLTVVSRCFKKIISVNIHENLKEGKLFCFIFKWTNCQCDAQTV